MQLRQFAIVERIIQAVLENTYIKIMAGLLLSIVSFLFDPATKMALFALMGLIFADFITSIVAIRITGESKRGNAFSSASAIGSAVKVTIYFIMIASGFMAEKAVPLPFIDETIIGFLAITELISILENAGRSGYAIPKKLLKMLIDMKEEK